MKFTGRSTKNINGRKTAQKTLMKKAIGILLVIIISICFQTKPRNLRVNEIVRKLKTNHVIHW